MSENEKVHRSCGECNACCRPFEIGEIGKERSKGCHHCVAGKGCAIYEHRPQVCKDFVCPWLLGDGDEADRPDRLGVLLVVQYAEIRDRKVPVLRLFEMRAGALDQFLIRLLAKMNKDVGRIVIFHRELDDGTYDCMITWREQLFFEEENETIRTTYARAQT